VELEAVFEDCEVAAAADCCHSSSTESGERSLDNL
jgi:hypothetical protein